MRFLVIHATGSKLNTRLQRYRRWEKSFLDLKNGNIVLPLEIEVALTLTFNKLKVNAYQLTYRYSERKLLTGFLYAAAIV